MSQVACARIRYPSEAASPPSAIRSTEAGAERLDRGPITREGRRRLACPRPTHLLVWGRLGVSRSLPRAPAVAAVLGPTLLVIVVGFLCVLNHTMVHGLARGRSTLLQIPVD